VVLYANQGASQFDPNNPVQGRIENPAGGYLGGSIGDYTNPGHVQRQLVVNGEVLARYGDAPVVDSTSSTPSYVSTAEFSLASSPLQLRGANADPVQYTVVESETLQSIARVVLGDASLWYTIAQANGLTGTETLSPGQVLTVPKTLVSANNSATFKPYDPTQVRGDTSPVQPDLVMPSGGGGGDSCGGLGQIIMIAIVIVVTVYSAGAMAAAGSLGADAFGLRHWQVPPLEGDLLPPWPQEAR
jgi:LysM repeat protein